MRFTSKPVLKLSITGKVLARYPSASAAAKANHFDVSVISLRCRGLYPFRTTDGVRYQYAGCKVRRKPSPTHRFMHS